MPTPFESAQLILTLYEQRREETMRKARDFMIGFDPKSFEELLAAISGPNGAYIRQVLTYWEMAATLVTNGAIDAKMFNEANGEHIAAFCKVEPFLGQMRELFGNPNMSKQLEQLIFSLPDARQRLDSTRDRLRAMIAARAAAAAKA